MRGPLEALRSETARALGLVLGSGGVSFVASAVRLDGHEPPLSFPPALDADGERLRREFGLPDPASRDAGHGTRDADGGSSSPESRVPGPDSREES